MLLHTCCGPCALPIIEYFKKEKPDEKLVLLFYNPNIYPKSEYLKRYLQVKKIAKIYQLKPYRGPYQPKKWLKFLKKNLSQAPESYLENSQRCQQCFAFRLKYTAAFAKKFHFKNFGTTLSINRFKDAKFINQVGEELAKICHLKYETFPLDIHQAEKISRELSQKYQIYRQKYCGCQFSLRH